MGRGNTGSGRRAGGRGQQVGRSRPQGFGPRAALAAGVQSLSRKAKYHLRELALAKKRDLEIQARDHAVRLLMNLKNQIIDTGAGVIRVEDLPTAVGALVAVPVLDHITTKMLNAAGKRTSNPSQEELLFSRYSSAMGFGQSSKCYDYNIEIDSPLKMPRKSGVREVTVPIYQGNKVINTGKWEEAQAVEIMGAGYNTRTTRFLTEGAACLPEKQLRRLLASSTRQRPTVCNGNANPTFFDVDSTKDILTNVYNPFSITSKTTLTNVNSNFGCRVTIKLVTMTDLEGSANLPIDYFGQQFTGVPDMYKLRDDNAAIIPVANLKQYFDANHHSLGQQTHTNFNAAEAYTHSSKNIFSDNQGVERFRVIGSKTFTLQPGETLNTSIKKYYNLDFSARGNIASYAHEYSFCGDEYVGLIVEATGVRGSVYECTTDANALVTDREFDYGTLPCQISVLNSTEMCNYWKSNPLFSAGDPVSTASANILYNSVYQRDAMGTDKVNLKTYYLPSNIAMGEENVGASSTKLIVPVNTTREVRAAGVGVKATQGVNK